MILTLTKDVARLGKIGDRVRVSDAYARNVLIPQKIGFVKEQTLFRVSAKQKESINHEEAKMKFSEPFSLKRKANEKGGLYEKISRADLERLADERLHIKSGSVVCELADPLSAVGTHDVQCALDGRTYNLHVVIEKE